MPSNTVTSKAKELGTWRISNYTPEYRETSGVGKRPVLTPDEVLRLPIDQALVIIRGKKPLKVNKFDYSKHPEYGKLRSCKASAHIPEWRRLEQEAAAAPKAEPLAQKKTARRKARTTQTVPAPAPAEPTDTGIIPTDKDSILS